MRSVIEFWLFFFKWMAGVAALGLFIVGPALLLSLVAPAFCPMAWMILAIIVLITWITWGRYDGENPRRVEQSKWFDWL